jgi:hypothetical protein
MDRARRVASDADLHRAQTFADVKTNRLFFTKGKPAEKMWYSDLSDMKAGKKSPLTLKQFEDFFA